MIAVALAVLVAFLGAARHVDLYSAFVEGAKEGLRTAAQVMPYLCAALLLWFNRLIFTRLISPAQQGTVPVFAVIPAVGDGDGLEQTLRHLHWLQGEKLSQFTLLIVDAGLTPTGQNLVQALQRKDTSLLFCPAEEATLILKRKDDHGYFSL